MGSRVFKDRLYREFASVAKALANPHRLELIDLLAQGERPVEELAREAALTVTNASAHLQVLRQARLVEADKRGLFVYYRLASSEVEALWRVLRELGGTLARRSDAGQRILLVDLTDGEPTEFAEPGVRARQAAEAVDHAHAQGGLRAVLVHPELVMVALARQRMLQPVPAVGDAEQQAGAEQRQAAGLLRRLGDLRELHDASSTTPAGADRPPARGRQEPATP